MAGSVLNNKWHMFGGRGSENYCVNSLHALDLRTLRMTPLKSTRAPKKREGHSCVFYREWLIVFGGCEGGDEDSESFNDICIYDTKAKGWSFPLCRGRMPTAREGHAAGVINNYMLIYGGNSNSLCSYAFMLSLKSFTWDELTVKGDSPGHRESMAYTTLRKMLYIFGGNSSPSIEHEDEFNNDLYSISLSTHDKSAICSLLETDGPSPPKRLSHSMSSLDNDRLITYGGEGEESILSDVWIYNLNEHHWREVLVSNTIPGRMSHILYADADRLLVFGGMDGERKVLNQIAILSIEESHIKSLTSVHVDKATNCSYHGFTCSCGHSLSTCEFLRRFPEVAYPKMHFFLSCQVPYSCLKELCMKYTDPTFCLFYISHQISKARCSIKAYHEVELTAKGTVKHLLPKKHILDLSFLPVTQEDDTLQLRGNLLKKWSVDQDCPRARVLMVSGDLAMNPDDFLSTCVGSSKINLILPCLAVSSTVVLVSKTQEFLSIALVTKDLPSFPCFAVVFDSQLKPVYPSIEIFEANLRNICQHSQFTLEALRSGPVGLSVFLFCPEVVVTNRDLFIQKSQLSVMDYLKNCYFENPGAVIYTLQDMPVRHYYTNEQCQIPSKHRSKDFEIFESSTSISKLLVYHENNLIYISHSRPEPGRHKRTRSDTSNSKVIILKSKKFLNPHTSLLKWNDALLGFFSAVNSGDYSELLSDYPR